MANTDLVFGKCHERSQEPGTSKTSVDHHKSGTYSSVTVKPPGDISGAPDGGWGWFVVFGSLLIHIILVGVEKSSGILFLRFAERYNQSALVIAWITSLNNGFRLILGPLSSSLCNRFSCRAVTMIGAVLLSGSMLLTAFASDLSIALIGYGGLGGIGWSLIYTPAVVCVGQYFNKRRGLAVGLATSAVGSFLFPTLVEALFRYYGYFGANLIIAGVFLNIMVCGSLFRPLHVHERQENVFHNKGQSEQPKSTAMKGKDTLPKIYDSKVKRSYQNVNVWFKNVKCEKKTIIDTSLLKKLRFVCFCGTMFLFTLATQSANTFIPSYAKQVGLSEIDGTYMVAMAAFTDCASRVISGFLLDIKIISKYRNHIYCLVLFFMGIVVILIPQTQTFTKLSVLSSLYGLSLGLIVSQKSLIIVDMLGVKKLLNAFGILLWFQGMGSFIGPPVSGAMKDINGHCNNGFYFGGLTLIFGAILLGIAEFIHYRKSTSCFELNNAKPKSNNMCTAGRVADKYRRNNIRVIHYSKVNSRSEMIEIE